MQILKPIEIIKDTILTSHNVGYKYQIYTTANSYSEGTYVTSDLYEDVFRAFVDVPIGWGPQPDKDNSKWQYISASNPWKAFDGVVADVVTNTADTIQYVFDFDSIDVPGITLINLTGTNVNVTVNTPTEVYNEDRSIITTSNVTNWYDYFFEEIEVVSSVSFLNLPTGLSNFSITITISGDGNLSVGEIIIGELIDLGKTKKDVSLGIIDYSKKNVDTFGNITIIPRGFSRTLDCGIIVETLNIEYTYNILNSVRTTPIVWVASDSTLFKGGLTIYGYMKDYELQIPHSVWGEFSIKIEGLT